MASSEEFETELDAYRERVEHPVWRLFRAYAPEKAAWLTLGLTTSEPRGFPGSVRPKESPYRVLDPLPIRVEFRLEPLGRRH